MPQTKRVKIRIAEERLRIQRKKKYPNHYAQWHIKKKYYFYKRTWKIAPFSNDTKVTENNTEEKQRKFN